MFENIIGLNDNLDELAVGASHFDTVFYCETKATRRRHTAELRLPGYCVPVLHPNGLGMVMNSRSGLAVSRLSMHECDCCEFMVVRACGARLNFN